MTIIGLSNYENVIGDFMKDIKEKNMMRVGKGGILRKKVFVNSRKMFLMKITRLISQRTYEIVFNLLFLRDHFVHYGFI